MYIVYGEGFSKSNWLELNFPKWDRQSLRTLELRTRLFGILDCPLTEFLIYELVWTLTVWCFFNYEFWNLLSKPSISPILIEKLPKFLIDNFVKTNLNQNLHNNSPEESDWLRIFLPNLLKFFDISDKFNSLYRC